MIGWFRDTFELSRGGASGNVRSMEGMRGLAVTAVFFVHYCGLAMPYANKTALANGMNALHAMGNLGVDLFFVLSGYLIYAAALKRPQYGQFMARRIRRIYPTFLTVFLVYLLLSIALPHESKIPSGMWNAVAYVAENALLLPGIFPIEPLVTVAWSLSYEMLYYLLIPLLVMGLGLHRWRRGNRIVLFLTLALVGVMASLAWGHVRVIMFIGGILLYELRDKRIRLPFVAPTALVAGFASMLLPNGTYELEAMHAVILFAMLPLFCSACFSQSSLSSKCLSAWPIRWLGNMSYSYYLLHGLVIKIVLMAMMHVHAPTGHEAMLVAALLIPAYLFTIAASAVLFVIIERPFSLRDSGPRMAAALS